MSALPPMTGGVLAGGAGVRMGGVDKGLLPWRGAPLVRHVLDALKPQCSQLLISANRNFDDYARFGVPVLCDQEGEGPLAGLATLLAAAQTPWLLCVPCDAPLLPADLGARLLQRALDANQPASLLSDAQGLHPTFCVVRTTLAASALQGARGAQGLGAWLLAQGAVLLPAMAPLNINTAQELSSSERLP